MSLAAYATIAISLFGSVQAAYDNSCNDNLVQYWGQNSYGAANPSDTANYQKTLSFYCSDSTTDVFPVAFLNVFFGTGGEPEIDLANICSSSSDPVFAGTELANCQFLAADIETCQAAGKIVTISLGGATGGGTFSSDAQAQSFADQIWNLFLGGTSTMRPFGAAVLDGVDLDIESGSQSFAPFVTQLRSHFTGASKKYYITAAPQCVYPDAAIGATLNAVAFDAIYVQFYNNPCGLTHYSDGSYTWNFGVWDFWARNISPNPNVKVYIGAPASSSAAGSGYVPIATLQTIAQQTQKNFPSFGGIMFWDASQSYANGRYDVATKSTLTSAGACGGAYTYQACTAPAFSATASYPAGSTVSYGGYQWYARWFASGAPVGSDDSNAWRALFACGGTSTGSTTTSKISSATTSTTSKASSPTTTSTTSKASSTTTSTTSKVSSTTTSTTSKVSSTTTSTTSKPTTTSTTSISKATTTTTPASGGSCSGVTAWSASATYTAGLDATYNGQLWQANQWNYDEVPGGASGAWNLLGTCASKRSVAAAHDGALPQETGSSKKALQQSESICSSANTISHQSSALVVDLLATDAKLKWISGGVEDQLNLATNAAQAMENQRIDLQAKATTWDHDRNLRAQALESVLETLSRQLVPPSLHQTSSSSSLFGSQHSGSPGDGKLDDRPLARSSAEEGGFIRSLQQIRKFEHDSQVMNDRTKWKSLRDFVDERGIEEAAERMDADRAALDVSAPSAKSSLSSTSVLGSPPPATPSIPPSSAVSPSSAPRSGQLQQALSTSGAESLAQVIETLLVRQDTLKTNMAKNLESLALHYDQMSQALRDHGLATETEISPTLVVGSAETYRAVTVAPRHLQPSDVQVHPKGIDMPGRSRTMPILAEEDMQVFARDAEELPAIIADIGGAASEINSISNHLGDLMETLSASLGRLPGVMDMLDALAEDMLVKMDDQNRVEHESILLHEALNAHLSSFDQLSETYHAYRQAYLRLLLEMDRRKRSRDAMEELVSDMVERLDQMRDEELSMREQFFIDQGPFLPDDLCPFVGDQPGRWAVTVSDETLLDLQESVLAEARQNLASPADDSGKLFRSDRGFVLHDLRRPTLRSPYVVELVPPSNALVNKRMAPKRPAPSASTSTPKAKKTKSSASSGQQTIASFFTSPNGKVAPTPKASPTKSVGTVKTNSMMNHLRSNGAFKGKGEMVEVEIVDFVGDEDGSDCVEVDADVRADRESKEQTKLEALSHSSRKNAGGAGSSTARFTLSEQLETPKTMAFGTQSLNTTHLTYPDLACDPLILDVSQCPWTNGKPAPYSFLAHAFVALTATRSRILLVNILVNTLRHITWHDSASLLATLYLLSNSISPAYMPVELNIGPSIISKALQSVSGLSSAALRKLYHSLGDAGDVAFEAKSSVRTLIPHPPLLIKGVYDSLLRIAHSKGNGAAKQKQSIVEKLLVASKGEEPRYLVRTFAQHLRVGAVRTTMISALARALVLTRPISTPPPDNSQYFVKPELLNQVRPLPVDGKKKAGNVDNAREDIKEVFMRAEALLKGVFVKHPNYEHIVKAILEHGFDTLAEYVPLTVGSPTRSLDEIYERLDELPFTAEFKYDGQRAQIHATRDEGGGTKHRVSIFSRHLEDMTSKYPDIISLVHRIFERSPEITSFIMDAEIVAIDPSTAEVRSFQELSNRPRKDVNLHNVKVVVCVYLFDLMYLNNIILLEEPFRRRRELLRQSFPPLLPEDKFTASLKHVESCESEEGREAVEEFFQSAVNSKSEGLMIKLLDSGEIIEEEDGDVHTDLLRQTEPPTSPKKGRGKRNRKPLPASYEPDKRTSAWLKLKKDYVKGLGDSFDLVPVGAWHGNGRKARWWSPVLLAIWDSQKDLLVAVCKCMSGFTDAFYQSMATRYKEGSELCARQPFKNIPVEYGDLVPSVYFNPTEVWELQGADITISPRSLAALGHISDQRGLSIRFPRFIRIREDKKIEDATGPEVLADMYKKQESRDGKKKEAVTGGVDEGDLVDVDLEEEQSEEEDF
ncbi:hypothetical protein FRB97_004866 [Tulasnella sp. 331]|nr:hypothetical protein FRB97_004866 [Tulasnella sp. 331]